MEESKGNATEALKFVPEIQQLIEEADDKTIGAQQALEGAESSAKNARDTAKQAQRIYDEQAAEVKYYIKSVILDIVAVVFIYLFFLIYLHKYFTYLGGK